MASSGGWNWGLYDREAELAALDAAIVGAVARRGQALLVEGPAGIGKSTLLERAAQRAAEIGLQVAVARAGELETSFSHGVTLQLFEAPVNAGRDDDTLFVGAAKTSRTLFDELTDTRSAATADGRPAEPDDGSRGAAGDSDEAFALLHGLYWLAVNVSRRKPLLLLVDDVQWADAPSLAFLAYLIPRIDRLPIAVIFASRSGDDADAEQRRIVDTLATNRVTRRFALEPLTPASVAALARTHFFPGATDEFCEAVFDSSLGNPFLVTELLRAADLEQIDATSDDAARQLHSLVPDPVRHSADVRLQRLSRSARRLAASLSVLAEDTNLRQASALARLSPSRTVAALDQLTQARIATYRDRIAFEHPLIRAAVYDGVPAVERHVLHDRAARLLATDGAPVEKVAAHLLVTEPSGEDWVVSMLWAAAERAMSQGSPESTVRYLTRALAEPPPDDVCADLLFDLGRAEAAIGKPCAVDRLRRAAELTTSRRRRAEAMYAVGRALRGHGDLVAAARVFEQAVSLGSDLGDDLSARLVTAYLACAGQHADLAPEFERRVDELVVVDTAQPELLATLAFREVVRTGSAARARELACRALEGGRLLAVDGPDGPAFQAAVGALAWSNFHDDARAVLAPAIEAAKTSGSPAVEAAVDYRAAMIHLFEGALDAAASHARRALAATAAGWDLYAHAAAAILAYALLDLGDLEGASHTVMASSVGAPVDTPMYAWLASVRGRVALAAGDPAGAIDAFRDAGTVLAERGRIDNPAVVQWRSGLALALDRAGKGRDAQAAAREEVELAERFGAPRPLGIALRTLGRVSKAKDGTPLLERAVAVLDSSGARLEHAKALLDFGVALARSNHRNDAAAHIDRAFALAAECGAEPVATRARAELRAIGARPTPRADRSVTGPDALTPSERRVAELARKGLTNKEIAAELYVSVKAVEYHLGHVYAKLGIASRRGLDAVLG